MTTPCFCNHRRQANLSHVRIMLLLIATTMVVVCGLAADVPFEVTPPAIVNSMMMLANIGPKSVVVDLGSGDGRIVFAALRHGAAKAIGVDADANLVRKATASAAPGEVESGRIAFFQGDFFDPSPHSVFRSAIRNASVMTLYWVPSVIQRLAKTLFDVARPGAIIISHDYPLLGYQPVAEWFAEGFQDKTKISGVDIAYLYKYVVGERNNIKGQHQNEQQQQQQRSSNAKTAVTKQCINNICTFKIAHDFSSHVPQHTVAYTQMFVSKDDPSLQWFVHVMVENGKLRAMWIPGLAVNGSSSAETGEHLGRRHGPVQISYRVRRLLPTDASQGVEGTGAVVVRGANTQTSKQRSRKPNKKTKVVPLLVDNLGLGDVAVPLSFTIAFDVISVAVEIKKRGDDKGGESTHPHEEEL